MSSHHFVKENQEPALYIMDPLGVDRETINSFLEWNPTVIINLDSWTIVKNWNIKVDIILIKENELTHAQREEINQQAPIKLLNYQNDEAPSQKLLNYLAEENYNGLNIVTDLTKLNGLKEIADPYLSQFTITFYADKQKVYWIDNKLFEKWARHEQLFQLHDQQEPIAFTGLVKSNTETDTLFTANHNGKIKITMPGPFWLGEEF